MDYQRVKFLKSEKKEKYFDLTRELKKNLMFIPFILGAFGKVTKGSVKGLEDLEIRGRVETIQTTALLRSARILRIFQEIWRDSSGRPSANAHVKNSRRIIIIIIIIIIKLLLINDYYVVLIIINDITVIKIAVFRIKNIWKYQELK